jgi:hypothetical protein
MIEGVEYFSFPPPVWELKAISSNMKEIRVNETESRGLGIEVVQKSVRKH